METLKEILITIAVAFVPVLVIYICRAANNLAEKALADIENDERRRYVEEISRAVYDAVCFTCQTYVDDLKGAKVFTEEAQAEARKIAIEQVMGAISPEALAYIKATYGDDVTAYLITKIETAVREARKVFVY